MCSLKRCPRQLTLLDIRPQHGYTPLPTDNNVRHPYPLPPPPESSTSTVCTHCTIVVLTINPLFGLIRSRLLLQPVSVRIRGVQVSSSGLVCQANTHLGVLGLLSTSTLEAAGQTWYVCSLVECRTLQHLTAMHSCRLIHATREVYGRWLRHL